MKLGQKLDKAKHGLIEEAFPIWCWRARAFTGLRGEAILGDFSSFALET